MILMFSCKNVKFVFIKLLSQPASEWMFYSEVFGLIPAVEKREIGI